jgi:hypothetical protein
VHGAHDHAIGYDLASNVQRLEQVWVGIHRFSVLHHFWQARKLCQYLVK